MITTASSATLIPFKKNRLLQGLLVFYALLWGVMAIQPVYPSDWALENVLVVLFVGYAWRTYQRQAFSELSYLLVFIFMCLHSVGAHYTYAETPLGFWMQDWFGYERNHYDRLVHFSFGLLLTYPVREFIMRHSPMRHPSMGGSWLFVFALSLSIAASGVYELIEWSAVLLVSPEAGQAYLGTQGDEFDAQKDTALASFGAFITLVTAHYFTRKAALAKE
jgi:putative membrane protein